MAILGPKLFTSYMAAPISRLSMLSAWESYKKIFKSTTNVPFDCRLDFLDEPEFENEDLKRIVSSFLDDSFGPVMELGARAFMIKIPPSFVQSFFRMSLNKLVKCLHEQTAKVIESSQPPVSCLLLAGGFSESPYLQEVLEETFESQVIISHSAGSIIQTGAVMYGLAPDTITSRIMRYTFGYRCAKTLDGFRSKHGAIDIPEKHKFDHKETKVKHVNSCFVKFIEKGETAIFSDTISHKIQTLYESQSEVTIDIFCTAKTTVPIFVCEPLVKKIGTFVVDVGNQASKKEISLLFRFGSTSLEVTGIAASTGEVFKIDCIMPN